MRFSALPIYLLTLSACAHPGRPYSMPMMEDRTLYVSEDVPGLEFRYSLCTVQFMGACFAHEAHKEYYDLRDEGVRHLLQDAGFSAKTPRQRKQELCEDFPEEAGEAPQTEIEDLLQ